MSHPKGHAAPFHRARGLRPLVLAVLALGASGLTACNEGPGFSTVIGDKIGVVVGDFDNIQETFNRQELDTNRFDGLISTATWVEDADEFNPPNVPVEALFLPQTDNEAEQDDLFEEHEVVFVASGSRGFGEREYNSLQPDDQIISNEDAVANAVGYVGGGGKLFLTDWTYDLVERGWPNAIDFLGDDTALDAAQRGDIGRVQAYVVDEGLREALGLDEAGNLAVDFSFGNWAVAESVSPADDNVKVWIEGTVTYRDQTGEGTIELENAPLLVTIDSGEVGGRVIWSAFHLDAQQPPVVDTLIEELVGDFNQREVIRDTGETP